MVKNIIHTFQKMNKDLSEAKSPVQFYYDAHNIRFITNNDVTTGALSFEKGNDLVLTIPTPVINAQNKAIRYQVSNIVTKNLFYSTGTNVTQPRNEIEETYFISLNNYKTSGKQIIIGHSVTRNNIILFTTDNNGFDCIWKIDDDFNITLLYLRNLQFSTNNPIEVIDNFENESIDKVYFIDNKSQMRFINIFHSIANGDLEELIDLQVNAILMVGKFIPTQPIIKDIVSGGIHTAGMIQYAYNLYKINSSQTKLSPFSKLIDLDKDKLGGGELNEVVAQTPIISISDIDKNYTHIKTYAIKYTSFNQLPSISLIDEREIPGNRNIEVFDDGNIISTLSLENFLFLGGDIIIPKNINSKDGRMFFASYKEVDFDVDLDLRAYSFNTSNIATVYDNLFLSGSIITGQAFDVNNTNYDDPLLIKFDSVNLDYNTFKYQQNGVTLGGEGKYIKYRLTQDNIKTPDSKFFKDEEIYRLAIQFYNIYGQISLPKWLADFKAPEGNLRGLYNTLEVTLKAEFYTWLNDDTNFENDYDKPIGYRILIAERTFNDRTIVANGLVSSMMVNNKIPDRNDDETYKRNISNDLPKLPTFFIRNLNSTSTSDDTNLANTNVLPVRNAWHMHRLDLNDSFYSEVIVDEVTAEFYQFNSMMQLFSPEITFGQQFNLSPGLKLKVKGALKNSYNAGWGTEYQLDTFTNVTEAKSYFGISPHYAPVIIPIAGNYLDLYDSGQISHPGGEEPNIMARDQYYRVYGKTELDPSVNGNLVKPITPVIVDIYGKPELIERGQDYTSYNNDSRYRYFNSLESVLTDGAVHTPGGDVWENEGLCNRRIVSVNAWGSKSIIFVTGDDDVNTAHWQRPTIEQLFIQTGISGNNYGLVCELVKTDQEIYLGNLYGGNSYEDKKRSNYIEIGDYKEINTSINYIASPGDTYVSNFRFERLAKTDTDISNQCVQQITEIVEFTTETTVDLKNRNDISLQEWDTKFSPKYPDYHKYNTVYSQTPNLVYRKDLNFNFKKITNFDTNIIPSKVKTPNELIDSWTDIQQNEILTMDGKYGAINGLISFKDELFTFQDKGIAFLSINPRVQVQGADGFQIELGKGAVLNEYKYITSNSGSINKWGIKSTEAGIYYLDALNKTFNLCNGQNLEGLSDKEGFHKYFLDNINIDVIKQDNPILYNGVSIGWDKITNDVYLSIFNSPDNKITLSFNMSQGGFSSFYDYHSSMYIYSKSKMLTINPNVNLNNEIYQNFIGDYNIFYKQNKLSKLAFIVNPEPYTECTFNNIEYKSEAIDTINNNEVNYTWERIRAFNEFQDSGLINLNNNFNIRKLNRKWRLNIPRDNKFKTNRIRNTWSIIEFESNNINKYKYRNNDFITFYNPINKSFN